MSKCFNCGSENWENADQYRNKTVDKKGVKINMCFCKDCGAVSYPDRIGDKKAMAEFYKKSYRPAPTVHNSFTGQRKNHFHYTFLKDLFDKWLKVGNKSPVICDVGTAFGMSLNMFKQLFPDAKIYGTELTETMKRVAYHEFGINLTDYIDETIQYDMIMSYKVLEHQIDPMEELKLYRKLIKMSGHLYISVPTWFDQMTNFGVEGFDLDTYYDPNHINVWTRQMFENMLFRAGWKIVKTDYKIYSSTYLCVPEIEEEYQKHQPMKYEQGVIPGLMNSIKKAHEHYKKYNFDEAIKAYPNYPLAWVSKLEMLRKELAEKNESDGGIGWNEFRNRYIEPMLACCPDSAEVYICATDFALRARMFKEAIEFASVALERRPNNVASLTQLINIYKEAALSCTNENEKIENFKLARETAIVLHNTSAQSRDEAINQIYLLGSLIPVGA